MSMPINIEGADPEVLLNMLNEGVIPDNLLAKAIVRLAKPFNQRRIEKAKASVASCLENSDPLVRHEAIWFLGCWAKLKEYEPQLINALLNDPDPDNRGFAATCIGSLGKATKDGVLLTPLASVVRCETEPEHVRMKAYAGLLNVAGRSDMGSEEEFEFSIGRHSLKEIDWKWVDSLISR